MTARILVVDDSPTIRKVVAAILSARAYEPLLASGGQEALDLLASQHVDLILLDFVMPGMNGYHFCRELRSSVDHRELPVVLMSAKGDKIREQFVQQTGAVDAIAKPFDARGLIAVVEGALKKQEEGRLKPVPDAEHMPAEAHESERPSRGSADEVGFRQAQALSAFTSSLERLLLPELARAAPALDAAAFRTAVFRALRADALPLLTGPLRDLEAGGGADVLAGDISVISIAEVLQLLDLQQQSGALAIFDHKRRITLYMRAGNLDLALSSGLGDEFLLGRYLIESGHLSREQLARALAETGGAERLIGETVTELGLLGSDDVRHALMRQSSELVYEVVRWKKGRFAFDVGVRHPIAERAALDLETGSLVMEGFRRVDEWRLIEGSFDFDEVLYPDSVAIERLGSERNLTAQERSVLEAIDGTRTIREIVDNASGSSFDICKILYQFLNSRLVRRKAA